VKYGAKIDHPTTLPPSTIADRRDGWVKSWTSIVL
jgi:thiamine transport system substrate-binding protein